MGEKVEGEGKKKTMRNRKERRGQDKRLYEVKRVILPYAGGRCTQSCLKLKLV